MFIIFNKIYKNKDKFNNINKIFKFKITIFYYKYK